MSTNIPLITYLPSRAKKKFELIGAMKKEIGDEIVYVLPAEKKKRLPEKYCTERMIHSYLLCVLYE